MNQNIDHLLELLQEWKSKEPEPITDQQNKLRLQSRDSKNVFNS